MNRIENADGKKLNYLPCTINEVSARLMDADYELYEIVTGSYYENDWRQIMVAVKMKK